ncbi:16S rRNA (cytosine(967)-C(5))-methyltransferase RsmB [Mangrovimicrobium sediminis]|uniref:16S rRNA (cytosine(967)-C(5))-methyltransferase n=1 Tax=Mangrovimicrobium sediminis TaxID=2562682 RepID=A0A4Z0LZJ8_9GAMM|nr:16S rRNA (cytosine(967)-C(5))-methyltransferase RsmB [Haliea sp. SAOS-164]TGD72813.1 16S rRNA (cytosine(967)-C(5))-methyltransferase RsmB [Haliea sp. SAOS-164]
MARNTRAVAARVLGQVLDGRSLNQALPAGLDAVGPQDRALLQQLCYGSLRLAPRLQGILDQLLDKPLRERDHDVLGLLLCGLYQLADTRIPPHAAVDETVAATRALKKHWAKGLCNAVLRRFQREREQLEANLSEAQRCAHPDWLFTHLQRDWPAQALDIIAANNQQAPMTLRINAAHGTREDYLARLDAADMPARPGELSPQAVYLAQARAVGELPGFAAGDASVQDEAAQMAALLLQVQAGERVLDACAAPGGKTCHILELQPALAELVAMDTDAGRLAMVEENLERLGVSARCVAGDASHPPAEITAQAFDRILVDAPCSGSGVIRRHPDIKLLRRAQDIDALARQQGAILDGLWPLLRRGGQLLYATCSVLRAENDGVVSAFIARQGDVRLLRPAAAWGETTECGRQLLPRTDGPDGLYYALLEKE